MVEVRTEKLQTAASSIRTDGNDLHISGEPGIGKTTFLKHLKPRLEDQYQFAHHTVLRHHNQDNLFSEILYLTRQAAARRDSYPNKLIGLSVGAYGFSAGGSTDQRLQHRHKIQELTANWSGEPLILFIDDIHKVHDNEKTVQEIIDEIAATLGDNVYLVTAGQISVSTKSNVKEVPLPLLSQDQIRVFLEATFDDVDEDTVQTVYQAVEGHPIPLRLLIESSDEITDLKFDDHLVRDEIQDRYLDSLPAETEEFLRQIAPLPEFSHETVNGILDDKSATEIDRKLRDLDRRVIVQEVNQTDEGNELYKIHEHFRHYLLRKHHKTEKVRRDAFEYHVRKILEIVRQKEEEDIWRETLPHAFNAKHHLDNLCDDVCPEDYHEELNRIGIEYPERVNLIIYSGFSMFSTEVVDLFQVEHEHFSDWLLEETENEPVAELLVQLVDWGISQFDDDPMELSDVQVDASLDDLPRESEPFTDIEMNDEQVQHLQRSLTYILSFFFEEEPYQSKEHRVHATKGFKRYGISVAVLKEFRERLEQVLLDSDLEDETGERVKEYFESLEAELEQAVLSSLDTYQIRTTGIELGQELFDSVHREVLLECGIIEELALECGEVLEDAENPAFALVWYSMFLTYFRHHPEYTGCWEELTDRFERMLAARQSYEEELDDPVLSAEDTGETIELDPPVTD